ncbi:MAG: cation transporter, partial [Pseudonocardiaceae bacterium]
MTTTAPAGLRTDVEVSIGGMTRASCVNGIERKLNNLAGVTATVNYATEKAHVSAPAGIDPAVIVEQIEAARYTAALLRPAAGEADTGIAEVDPMRPLRERLIASVVLSVPVIAMAMVPALRRWTPSSRWAAGCIPVVAVC